MQTAMVYQTLFYIGALGTVVMGALGAGRGAHGGHGGHGGAQGHGHVGHGGHGGTHTGHGGTHAGQGTGHGAAHGHTAHGPSGSAGHGNAGDTVGAPGGALLAVMGVLSPLTLFSVSLGAGAAGMLLASRYDPRLTALLALAAGVLLLTVVIRPLMGLILRFASTPALTLAGSVATEAEAQNRFEGGRGIVTATVDGQLVRLLAFLEPDDAARGVVVAARDRVVITYIDEAKNTCRVTKL